MRYIYTLLLLIFFTSCVTQQKVARYLEKHPQEFLNLCKDEFPVDTTYIKGETIVKTDTIVTPGDSIECPKVNEWDKPVKVKCPDTWVVTNEVTRIDTVVKTDPYQVRQLELELNQKDKLQYDTEDKLKKEEESSAFWFKASAVQFLLIALYLLYRMGKAYIKRRIPLIP